MKDGEFVEVKGSSLEQMGTRSLVTCKNLNEKDIRAMQLRYSGMNSQAIAKATGYRPGSVRKLFMHGGRLEKPYRDFMEQSKSELMKVVEEVRRGAREAAVPAFERMKALAEDADGGAVAYKANEYILSVAGVSPKDREMLQDGAKAGPSLSDEQVKQLTDGINRLSNMRKVANVSHMTVR